MRAKVRHTVRAPNVAYWPTTSLTSSRCAHRNTPVAHFYLAAALAQLGQLDKARAASRLLLPKRVEDR